MSMPWPCMLPRAALLAMVSACSFVAVNVSVTRDPDDGPGDRAVKEEAFDGFHQGGVAGRLPPLEEASPSVGAVSVDDPARAAKPGNTKLCCNLPKEQTKKRQQFDQALFLR